MLAAAEGAAKFAKHRGGLGPGPSSQEAISKSFRSGAALCSAFQRGTARQRGRIDIAQAAYGACWACGQAGASVSDATMQAGVQRILQAMRKRTAADGAAYSQLAAAAREMELERYASSASQPYGLSKQAHIGTEAQAKNSAANLLQRFSEHQRQACRG
ncbi:g4896 [Coccomyxa elongata]